MLYIIYQKDQQVHCGFMNVILLYSKHVSALMWPSSGWQVQEQK